MSILDDLQECKSFLTQPNCNCIVIMKKASYLEFVSSVKGNIEKGEVVSLDTIAIDDENINIVTEEMLNRLGWYKK